MLYKVYFLIIKNLFLNIFKLNHSLDLQFLLGEAVLLLFSLILLTLIFSYLQHLLSAHKYTVIPKTANAKANSYHSDGLNG